MPFPNEERSASGAMAPSEDATSADDAGRAVAVEEYQALLRSAEQLLDDVDRALESLDAGDYGACATCGAPIEDRVLEDDPLARRCTQHRVPGER